MSEILKIVVTVPETDADSVREAIGAAGGGKVGNYTNCSFSTKGIGRFTPNEGAHPAIGIVGTAEQVLEERIEVNCNRRDLKTVLTAIRTSHPYEEPAIDVYQLLSAEDY